MPTKILILVDYLGYLRRYIYITSSLNLNIISSILKKYGLNFEIKSYQDILETSEKPENCIIWYASSDMTSYRNYIEDILLYLKDDNILVPRFDLFRSHENKGFQVLLRKKMDLPVLDSHYFGTVEELYEVIDIIIFPVVLKKITGSGSENVHLIQNRNQLIRTVKSQSKQSTFFMDLAKKYLKRYVFTGKYKYSNTLETLYHNNFILQKFIENFSKDWRVLIFFDKYYVLTRDVRKNDFRASGSKKKYYREIDFNLLDYSEFIFKKLNTPWASLDICRNEDGFHLLEFQAVNFASKTCGQAPYYFARNKNNKWEKREEKSDVSTEFAESFVKHIKSIINSGD
jgi:glutathione synthase/RimK-type ligase-like ATP-grasp enzyme